MPLNRRLLVLVAAACMGAACADRALDTGGDPRAPHDLGISGPGAFDLSVPGAFDLANTDAILSLPGDLASNEPILSPPPPVHLCGDGICDSDETCMGCSQDCGCGYDENCDAPRTCDFNPKDGVCSVGEDCHNSWDCCPSQVCVNYPEQILYVTENHWACHGDGFCDRAIGETCRTNSPDCACESGNGCFETRSGTRCAPCRAPTNADHCLKTGGGQCGSICDADCTCQFIGDP